MGTVHDFIIEDIKAHGRGYLPGSPCTEAELREKLKLSILVDGLEHEEQSLALSLLPSEASGLYLSPLDKGLSGSKVFAARYVTAGRLSKPFVLKIGPIVKLQREADAI